ncbi:hypothetical protein FSP39_011562 [Pinctada imbricata]|uniref:STING ligand-binding domain-containing protein n=1 Tax=Pinctada imbricata TaxID=66713 RepID=A0AA88YW23_PINIB|nr:hypothetical protein FSP39_011562 [Pinctada imbricata]
MLFPLLLVLQSCDILTSTVFKVSKCPCGKSEWQKQEREMNCNDPACLIPVRQRLTIKSSLDVDQLCSLSKATAEETPTNDSKIFIIKENHVPITPTILVCLVTLACFTMATAFIIVAIRRQRYRSTRKPMEEGFDSAFKEYINYANGLAWSHYTGFLSKLLPVLEDAIKGSKTFKEHPDRTSTLWIMLCPKSGMSSRLEDDDTITVEESLSIPGIKQPIDIFRIQRNKLEKEDSNIPDVCMLYDGEQKGKKRYLDFENAVSRSCRPSILDFRSHDKRIIIKVLALSRWIVLYNIDDEIRYKYPWLLTCLEEMVHEGTSDIIAIYSGKSQEEWTKCIPWTVAIDIDKECYAAEKVQKIINGKTIELATDIAIGDLSFGLAWAFYVNYLKPVTHDLHDRVTEVLNEELNKSGIDGTTVKSSNYFWQIIPTSCSCVPLNEIDDHISSPIVVKPLKTKMYGAQRVFPCNLYSIKRGNAVYYFVGEMFTPCKVLKAMKESNIVHLSDAAMKKQLRQLKHTLQNLLKYIEGANADGLPVKIIHFEDRGHSALSDELIKSISSEDPIEKKLTKQYKYSLSEECMSMLSSKEE